MALSTDLISQFVKNTKDETTTKPETTTYGTVRVTEEGEPEVQLDGSATYIPIKTTVEVKDGDRVVVMIKNHTATITGNLTSPAAKVETVTIVEEQVSTKVSADVLETTFANVASMIAKKANITTLNTEISNVKNLIADKASIDQLTAESVRVNGLMSGAEARITSLEAADVTISGRVEANEAAISSLQTDKLDAANAKITYATIDSLNSATADIDTLKATKLDVDKADMLYVTTAELEATLGNFGVLDTDVARVTTLIFGSATGDTIQTSFANAVIAQLGDAQIKSAMIENVSADKITSGDIITNNVRVRSEDGSLVISDETLQISDGTRVRVQIGKDAAEDYSINIWDQNGNLMFSKGGITDAAIKEAIIRNDMVSDTANIHASKLDIDSLFEEINGSSNTIKSTQIHLDDKNQNLDVAFKEITTTVTELGETVNSQGTAITAVQGQISSKVWQEDISEATNEISTQYSTLEQALNNVSATVVANTSQINAKADSSEVTTVSDRVTRLEADLEGFESTVSSTYATKTELSTTDNKATDAQNNINALGARVAVTETAISQNKEQIALRATKNEVSEALASANANTTELLSNYSTTSEMNAAIALQADGITSTVSNNYATKTELGSTNTDVIMAQSTADSAQETADEASVIAINAETLVKQLSDSISMLVTDGNGTSLMTQTDDGWTFSTSNIQTQVNNVSESLNALEIEVGDTSHTIDILQQAIDDLGTISEYVKIGTYEDEPCIELGESDSEFKLRITNTRMIFTEGSTELAYFNNQSLHIVKAVVEDELQQGNFVWKTRSNGNLGLTWKGGN